MKEDANLIRGHLADIVCWTRTRQPNGFLEGLSGYLPAHRQARLFKDKPLCGAAHLKFKRAKIGT